MGAQGTPLDLALKSDRNAVEERPVGMPFVEVVAGSADECVHLAVAAEA